MIDTTNMTEEETIEIEKIVTEMISMTEEIVIVTKETKTNLDMTMTFVIIVKELDTNLSNYLYILATVTSLKWKEENFLDPQITKEENIQIDVAYISLTLFCFYSFYIFLTYSLELSYRATFLNSLLKKKFQKEKIDCSINI